MFKCEVKKVTDYLPSLGKEESDTIKLIRKIEDSVGEGKDKYLKLSATYSASLIVLLTQIKVNHPDLYKDVMHFQLKRFDSETQES